MCSAARWALVKPIVQSKKLARLTAFDESPEKQVKAPKLLCLFLCFCLVCFQHTSVATAVHFAVPVHGTCCYMMSLITWDLRGVTPQPTSDDWTCCCAADGIKVQIDFSVVRIQIQTIYNNIILKRLVQLDWTIVAFIVRSEPYDQSSTTPCNAWVEVPVWTIAGTPCNIVS